MVGIYVLKSMMIAEEYIKLDADFSGIKIPCIKSEFQFLDRTPLEITISDEGGLEIPDVIYQDGMWLISTQLKECLERFGCDYVFYKQVKILSDKFGIHETFWIIVPPRIDCLDLDDSIIKEKQWDFEDGLVPSFECEKIKIMVKNLGNYAIFKILGILDNNIYVTEELFQAIHSLHLEGIEFIKIQ